MGGPRAGDDPADLAWSESVADAEGCRCCWGARGCEFLLCGLGEITHCGQPAVHDMLKKAFRNEHGENGTRCLVSCHDSWDRSAMVTGEPRLFEYAADRPKTQIGNTHRTGVLCPQSTAMGCAHTTSRLLACLPADGVLSLRTPKEQQPREIATVALPTQNPALPLEPDGPPSQPRSRSPPVPHVWP